MNPAVFFDMDGVLIDSEPVWQEEIAAVYAEVGLRLTPELMARTMGMGNEESVRLTLAHNPQVHVDVAEICRMIDARVLQRIGQGIGAIPGADDLVRALARDGVPLALVSTSGPALMQAVIRAHKLSGLFQVVLSSEEVGPGKPDPAVYREAIRRMQADAAASVAIEDTPNGARSASGAGLKVIGFARDEKVVPELRLIAWRLAPDYAKVSELIRTVLANGRTKEQKS